jgi:Flp pilus assembly secretin CpaC
MKGTMSCALLALLVASTAASAVAQEKPERPRKLPTPLRVQIVFAKYQGERKVSSMPYTLSVNADDRATAMRMGIQVPLTTRPSEQAPSAWVYKDVGTSLDCSAEALGDGSFRLAFSLEQSSLSSTDVDRKAAGGAVVETAVANAPLLRNFKSQTSMVMRDGQTAQYVTATDPVSGEVLKIDVTLSVLK